MQYFLWCAPFLAVIVGIASGRLSSLGAGILGTALAAGGALTAAPVRFGLADAASAAARACWLATLLSAVILGGLFFREIVTAKRSQESSESLGSNAQSRRRVCFAACFLIGPFTEASTGYGVGQVATVSLLRALGLAPLHVAILGLFSQMLVPWGAMANGTIIGATLARLSPQQLGLNSAFLTAALLSAWLPVFWLFAATAGLRPERWERIEEIAWTAALAGLLVAANAVLTPDVAALAALGLVISVRFLAVDRPQPKERHEALRVSAPYAALVLGLVACRSSPSLAAALEGVASLQPFPDEPVWYPLLHPGSWLVAIGCLSAVVAKRPGLIPSAARTAWRQGARSVATIVVFLIMAQMMAASGVTNALARAVQASLGPVAALATPLLAGAIGFLCGSANASNSLLMTPQADLAAQVGLSVPWLAAVQNTAAAAMTMFSPLRLTMGCALAAAPGRERDVYTRAWPLGAAAILILVAASALLILFRGR